MPADQAAWAVDQLGVADTLFNEVSQSVCQNIADNDERRQLLLRQKTLVFTAGEATLTSDVLQDYLWDSVLVDATSSTTLRKKYTFRPYPQFIQPRDNRVGVYAVRGADTMVLCDPNVSFASPLTSSGTRLLNTPCVIEKPAASTDDVVCPFQVESDLIEALSNALRGTLSRQAGEEA
jgi:hypothetical protein